ncbi:RAMP superfamily CRISPR-associated protein [Saccharolobus sp. E5-1-F]|uniref:RAMP superfamily CRISPR-associated protein n=1 Tax=Saccharolobus sp. E5-1-F TaxID=2663019 RepID=UPI0013869558|nr:RAMP superfamily CRISPR-associated protein [Sulfolobus sp. E5-1-F]
MVEVNFKTYYILTKIWGKITNKSPIRVGGTRGYGIGEPDLPILRTPDRRAVIPGSTLKGVFRNSLARYLKNVNPESDLAFAFGGNRVIGGSKGKNNLALGSAVIFSDFTTRQPIDVYERTHIKIDLSKGSGRPFQVEYVPENNEFEGTIIGRNLPLSDMSGMIYVVKNLMDLEVVRIGGFKSRGYGIVRFDVAKVEVYLPSNSVEFETRLGILSRGITRKISIKVENNSLKENEKSFTIISSSSNELFNKYEINVDSFYNVGKTMLEGG